VEQLTKTNLFLQDLISLHGVLWKFKGLAVPGKEEDLAELSTRIVSLIKTGKSFELAGLRDVPKQFMKSTGRFLSKVDNEWEEMNDEDAKNVIAKRLLAELKEDRSKVLSQPHYKDFKDILLKDSGSEPPSESSIVPDPKDAILLRYNDLVTDKIYDQQAGNKAIFNLASGLVTSFTKTSEKRLEAALSIMKGFRDIEFHQEGKEILTSTNSRFLLRTPGEETTWTVLNTGDAAEFALIFVFEVFLEKGIDAVPSAAGVSEIASENWIDTSKPGTVGIKEPTDHDVLFGRGGMTNSHLGNKRFRDIIALHRPDYIRAIKMDKPAVARKIVKAIRHGTPPGRFMRKGEDGTWYDVGDRTAAEKTSQGLRERSNAEKRQRSALREALRIRREDMTEPESGSKKQKTTPGIEIKTPITQTTLNYVGTNLPVPLSLGMKDQSPSKKTSASKREGVEELKTEGLPPNAVDEEGNILVTDYDILCGRGGLTNHHKGNKRFRDIVALHRPDYVRAPKIQKPSVARVIVRAIRNGDPPGRFLRKDESTGKWVDIGDKKAAEKTSQALREKSNEERDKVKGDPGALASVLLPNPASYLAAASANSILVSVPQVVPGIKTEGEEKAAGGKHDDEAAIVASAEV